MTERASLDEVKTRALETAYRFDAYQSYGGSLGGALLALNRRCPGWERDELEPWLDKALAVQRDARPWLEEHEAEPRRASDEDRPYDFAWFRETHPGWPDDAIDNLLGLNFLYFFLK